MDPLSARALELAEGLTPTANSIEKVAGQVGMEPARWAFTQWELRQSARNKFEHADEMLFTREALEQSTRTEIALYHASRFPEGALVADLTCGIGADLIFLAGRGPAVGFDLDPERIECARHNLSVYGRTTETQVADCLETTWPEYVFADPARRVGGVRRLDPSMFAPDPTILARRMSEIRLGGIKLTPLLQDAYLESLGSELAFVASADECPEVVVWCGLDSSPGRYAIRASDSQRLDAGLPPPSTEELQDWFYEAHPAAIRAHALGTLCDQWNLRALGDTNGYLTGSEARSPWLKCYRVVETIRGDLRAVKAALKAHGSRTPVIKSRAGVDVEAVRRQLKLEGDRTLIVAAYNLGKSLRFAILSEA